MKASRLVVSFTRSSLNHKWWLVKLTCGHEQWITRYWAPKIDKTKVDCGRCGEGNAN